MADGVWAVKMMGGRVGGLHICTHRHHGTSCIEGDQTWTATSCTPVCGIFNIICLAAVSLGGPGPWEGASHRP